MQKNVAGQKIGAALVSATDGSAVTSGTTTVYITLDGGTQSTGSTAVHEGQGHWTYAPSQAETNGDHCAYTFINSSAVPATVQVYTRVDANAIEISGDATAADNLESACDNYSATRGLAGTALPAAAAGAAAGLPTDSTGKTSFNDLSAAQVNAECDTALTDYDPPTNTEMEARTLAAASYATAAKQTDIESDTQDIQTQIGTAGAGLTDLGGMSTGMKAEILVEVNAAIDTAISELGVAAPTATPTLRTGMMLMYMALRNKLVVQTSGTDAIEIYNDAGTKIAAKTITDDGSDYTEAEMA